jgi:peptidoglycan/LPS O-acetylase OafA/YrhL
MNYRREIDGLRAVAVLTVIAFHAQLAIGGNQIFPGGYLGVDIFFVISGYLIAKIIFTHLQGNDFSFVYFYERRTRRILPAFTLITFTSIAMGWLYMDGNQLMSLGKSALFASIFISNFWSLAVEEQFYITFPVMLLLFWKILQRYLTATIICLLVGSLAYAHWLSIHSPDTSFYMLPSRAWELLVGVLLARLEISRGRENNLPASRWLPVIGLLMVIVPCLWYDRNTLNPGLPTAIPVAGAALIIWFCNGTDPVSRLLGSKSAVGIGLLSYSMYLWHQPILAFTRINHLGELPAHTIFWFPPLLLALSWASWWLVEKPCRDSRKVSNKQLIAGCIIFWPGLISLAWYVQTNQGFPQRTEYPISVFESVARDDSEGTCSENPQAHIKKENWFCELSTQQERNPDFFVFGDSHAYAALPAFRQLADSRQQRGQAIADNGCLPFLGIEMARKDQNITNCKLLHDRVYRHIKDNHIHTLYLVARWRYYTDFSRYYKLAGTETIITKPEKRLELFQERLQYTLEQYKKIGVQVVIMGQVPPQNHYPLDLYREVYSHPEKSRRQKIFSLSATRKDVEEKQKSINAIMESFSQKGLTRYINPINAFCNDSVCPIGTLEHSFYYDDDHISIVGNNLLLHALLQEPSPAPGTSLLKADLIKRPEKP